MQTILRPGQSIELINHGGMQVIAVPNYSGKTLKLLMQSEMFLALPTEEQEATLRRFRHGARTRNLLVSERRKNFEVIDGGQ